MRQTPQSETSYLNCKKIEVLLETTNSQRSVHCTLSEILLKIRNFAAQLYVHCKVHNYLGTYTIFSFTVDAVCKVSVSVTNDKYLSFCLKYDFALVILGIL